MTNPMLENVNVYKRALLTKLAMWDWTKPSWNHFSAFFDDAYTIIADDKDKVIEFNERLRIFEGKFKMTVSQAEIRVFLRIQGISQKRMIEKEGVRYETYGEQPLFKDIDDREIKWLDIVEELRS